MFLTDCIYASLFQSVNLLAISWNPGYVTCITKHWCGLSSIRWRNNSELYNRAIDIDRESSLLFLIQVSTR